MRIHMALVVAATILNIGCGDDNDSTVDAGPPPIDQCLNPSDIAIARGTVSGDGGLIYGNDAGIDSLGDYYANCAVADCLPELLGQDRVALEACLLTCVAPTPADGLSAECRSCYLDILNCAAITCATFCLADRESVGCHECYEDACEPPAKTCTGLENL